MKIKLTNIDLDFGSTTVLDDLELTIQSSSLTCLLGRSGSGKTSILKLIAGILQPGSGSIYFNDELVNDIPTQGRNVGWVPQQQLIFPGLSVRENINYGLQARNKPREFQNRRIEEVAELVGLNELLERRPAGLSGGEKQRVALARALAPEPDLLLLDEPFSSLDAPERDRLSLAFREVQLKTNVTTVHVTHSPREAELLSDEVHILSNGSIIQSGTFGELMYNPASVEVAKLLNIPNFVQKNPKLSIDKPSVIPPEAIELNTGTIPAKILSHTPNRIYLQVDDSILETQADDLKLSPGKTIMIAITAELVRSI